MMLLQLNQIIDNNQQSFYLINAGFAKRTKILAAGVSTLALGITSIASAQSSDEVGVFQYTEDNIAINLLEFGTGDPTFESGTSVFEEVPGGQAVAEALVYCGGSTNCPNPGAIVQVARGTESASNSASLGGSITIAAEAAAMGASASGAGVVQEGIRQVASADELAANNLENLGALNILAGGIAIATSGSAVAFAGIGAGLSQVATSIGVDGLANNAVVNSGNIQIVANAEAQAQIYDAGATAFIGAGVLQQARGQEAASADFANTGSVSILANAQADAASGLVLAQATAAGILQFVAARTQQFSETTTSGGDLVGTLVDNPSGPAEGSISNTGSIMISANAAADGYLDGTAVGAALGLAQQVSGAPATASIDNSGSIEVLASVDVVANGTPRGTVFVSGISQVASAYAYQTIESIDQNGVLTYQLSSTPVGPALATFTNDGEILVRGDVNVVGLGTSSAAEAVGVAFVDGFDQSANGSEASAEIVNEGSFSIIADVSVDSGNLSTGVAISTGIDQFATAYAVNTTLVFASGTSFPTSGTGSGFAVGPASATYSNSGSLTVIASVDTHGDAVAFGGATASAIGQLAAGTEASAVISNDGSIVVVGTLSSSGLNAFGGAGAIGLQQAAQGTAIATAAFNNNSLFSVLAHADAEGELGGFVNATAFGGVQAANSAGISITEITNNGTIDIRATASASAGHVTDYDLVFAFANAHGLGQLAEGQQALTNFENSGDFLLLSQVEGIASDLAFVAAGATGVIQQIASGSTAGTATAVIENNGTILVGAIANAAALGTAVASAAVRSAFLQAVSAGESASASFSNSGSITLLAEAEAFGHGENDYGIGSALALASGNVSFATATGAAGEAYVNSFNSGSIEIGAMAHATGSGMAHALATAAYGMIGTANSFGAGLAAVELTNTGLLSAVGVAEATGGYTANATGIALGGMQATASSSGDAAATLANSGELTLAAYGHASAGTNAIAVAVAIDGMRANATASAGDALSKITNDGDLLMVANASASALNAQAFAIAGGTFFAAGVLQSTFATNGNASALADNSGSISIVANALANGDVIASASAIGGPGFAQFVFTTSGDASAGITNSGSMDFVARAEANAANSAFASAVFFNAVAQGVNAFDGQGGIELTNEGAISVTAAVEASGGNAGGAFAVATHLMAQAAFAVNGDATIKLANNGSIELTAAALANGSVASATVEMASALFQDATVIGDGDAAVAIDNSGAIEIMSLASAESADGTTYATASIEGGIIQFAGARTSEFAFNTTSGGLGSAIQQVFPTGQAQVEFNNSGSLEIGVGAFAVGGTSALADASGAAIRQAAFGIDANVALVNQGELDITLVARAQGNFNAAANGVLAGVEQAAVAAESTIRVIATSSFGQSTTVTTNPVGSAQVEFANSGAFQVAGMAEAIAGNGSATATMAVRGVSQSIAALDADIVFANEGAFAVMAQALADGVGLANAYATATGYRSTGTGAYQLNIENSGSFQVIAQASAIGSGGQAGAYAFGMEIGGFGPLSGSISNQGTLLVRAQAGAGSDDFAFANGIRLSGNADNASISNTGTIAVEAITDGGESQAIGIQTIDYGSGTAGLFNIVNDGGIIAARQSSDGGATWSWGTAIDLSLADSASTINLTGDGRIYGNIDLASGQTINVSDGETWFSGLINPECGLIACGQGTLDIANGGALFFRHDSSAANGPSAAYLEELNVGSDGTLIFEMPAGSDPQSSYPRIITGTANLDGTLLIRSESGLYANSYTFDDVIDADVRNGQFDKCGIDAGPALLALNCVYDSNNNVDLELVRIAFNAVSGMTRNQAAVGSGIEQVYSVELEGPFADLVGQLFTFDAADYRRALDQLSGASHAAYLQSFNALGESQSILIERAIGCQLPAEDVSTTTCRTGKLNVWGQVDYTSRESEGDQEALGYDSDRWTAIVGVDGEVGEDVIVGGTLAKLSNNLSFQDGGRWTADGYQFGTYAAIDRGRFYGRVIGSIASFDGDSRRTVNWTGFGGTLVGQINGDPDVEVWTLGANAGYRIGLGEKSLMTPYLSVVHSSAEFDAFAENGLTAANLALGNANSSRTRVTAGTKFTVDHGRLVSQIDLGYRHLLGDRRSSVDTAFVAQDGSDFRIVSAVEDGSAALVGFSLGGKIGVVDLRVGYQGLFDNQTTSHSGNIRVSIPLGKR